MNARFYAPDAQASGEVIDLPAEEAAHLTRVLRLKDGAAVRVFNGRGTEFDALVCDVARNRVRVHLKSSVPAAPERRIAVTLAHAVLKGDKMDEVIRDAVMMGIAAIQPIVTARSEVTLQTLARSRRNERWQRISVSSAKQCGRAIVPQVYAPLSAESVIRAITEMALPTPALMFVEPGAASEGLSLADLQVNPPREATVLVGPEGGWTSQEISDASTVSRLITLKGPTLRADAMPLVALSALFTVWQEL